MGGVEAAEEVAAGGLVSWRGKRCGIMGGGSTGRCRIGLPFCGCGEEEVRWWGVLVVVVDQSMVNDNDDFNAG